MNQILIITVNYKDTDVTEKLIRSLQNLDTSNNLDLVIVDSEATVQTKERLKLLAKNTPFKTLSMMKLWVAANVLTIAPFKEDPTIQKVFLRP